MPVSESFLKQVRLRNTTKSGKNKKLKKPPIWLYPYSPERQYTAALYRYTFEIRKVIRETLLPKIPIWLAAATITYPDPIITKSRRDSWIDDIISDLNDTLLLIDELLQPSENRAIQFSKVISVEIANFNNNQFDKQVHSVLGIDIFQDEPWLLTQLELFANQNAQLITNMTDNEIERVSGIVQRGLQEGSTYDQLAKQIRQSFGVTRRHAKLIARDQTTKLNGSLTKLRQQQVGLQTYEWVTSGDERVRQSHRVLDGKLCRWDDPTVYLENGKWVKRSKIGGTTVHPSQDVNCRCNPGVNFEEIFAK